MQLWYKLGCAHASWPSEIEKKEKKKPTKPEPKKSHQAHLHAFWVQAAEMQPASADGCLSMSLLRSNAFLSMLQASSMS